MIPPREFRIGNYIRTPYHRFVRITDISTDGCKVNASMLWPVGREMITNSDNYILNKYISPIPLTEDILLKCGFKKGHSMDLICDDCFTMTILASDMLVDVFKNKSENSWYIHIDDESCCSVGYAKDIVYLHELQNLFYDLTKTELNVQL